MTLPILDRRTRRARLWWRGVPVVARDAAGGVLLLVVSLLPLGVAGVDLGGLHSDAVWWVPPVLAAGQSLPLALRRVAPVASLALVGVAFGVAQLAGVETGVAGLGLFFAIYSFAAYQRRHHYFAAASAAAAYIVLALALQLAGSPEQLIDWGTFFLVLVIPWLIGQLVSRELSQQALREAAAADAAVRKSRNRLARDLHDIVTHRVTAMVVQADSAAYLDDAAASERAQSFEMIAASGRRALQELRSLLGALEHSPANGANLSQREPLPGAVADIVGDAAAAGYPVTLNQEGMTSEVSETVSITLYRIAQEALTNAMKHAPGTMVDMALTESDGIIDLRIENDLTDQAPDGPGRGRQGMAARVALLGGQLETGVVHDRFIVHATIEAHAEAHR